jgi:hypothetical protein
MHASDLLRWAVGVPLALLGVWIVLLNFRIAYVYLARREHHSWVPLVGGFVALVGMGICPLPRVQKMAWVPLAVDVGYCVSILALGLLMTCLTKRGGQDDG